MALLVLGRALQALEAARHDLGQEAVQVGEPLGAHAQQPARAVAALVDQPGLPEDLQVLRDRGLAHREARRDLRRAHLAAGEQAHDLATLGLGEGLEDLHTPHSLYKRALQRGASVIETSPACGGTTTSWRAASHASPSASATPPPSWTRRAPVDVLMTKPPGYIRRCGTKISVAPEPSSAKDAFSTRAPKI